jgi:hypothetical protein
LVAMVQLCHDRGRRARRPGLHPSFALTAGTPWAI